MLVFKGRETKITMKIVGQLNQRVTGKTKAANQSCYEKYNKRIENWQTFEATATQLKKAIEKPVAFRMAIKQGGNRKEHIKYVTGIVFDFDNDDPSNLVTIPAFLKLKDEEVIQGTGWKYGDYALIYETFSSTRQLVKFRVVYVYDKPISIQAHEDVYKYLLENNEVIRKCDKSCFDAGRAFIGGLKGTCSVNSDANHVIVGQVVPKVREQLQAIASLELKSDSKGASKPTKSSGSSREDYLIKELKRAYNVQYLSDIPPSELFYAYRHEFMRTSDDAKNIRAKYHGKNPFSSTNSSGQSFVISYIEDEYGNEKLPIWYDRSANDSSKTKSGGNGSNYFEYIMRLTNVGNFDDAWLAICEHFEINPKTYSQRGKSGFDKAKVIEQTFANYDGTDLENIIDDYMMRYVYKVNTSDDCLYYFKVGNLNKWEYTTSIKEVWNDSIVTACVRPYLKSVYTATEGDEVSEEQIEKIIINLICEPEFKSPIMKIVEKFTDKLNQVDNEDFVAYHDDYIHFVNGYWSVKDKSFSSELPEGVETFNSNCYKFPYNPNVEECREDFEWFCEVIDDSYNTKKSVSDRKTFKLWTILNVLKAAYKTQNVLCIMGTAGTGKTGNSDILMGLMGNYASSGNEAHFNGQDRFGYSHYAHSESIIINEFKGSANTAEFKKVCGSGKAAMPQVEFKGKTAVNHRVYWAFTLVTEGIPYQKVDDDGMKRRLVYIDHNDVKKYEKGDIRVSKRNTFIDELLKNNGYWGGNFTTNQVKRYSILSRNIVSHIVRNYDPKVVLEEWREHVGSIEYQERSRAVVNENNPVNDFVETHIEITNDPEDFVASRDMESLVNIYLKEYPNGKKPFMFNSSKQKSQLYANIASFGWDLYEPNKKIRGNLDGNRVLGHRGLKLKQADNLIHIDGLIESNKN